MRAGLPHDKFKNKRNVWSARNHSLLKVTMPAQLRVGREHHHKTEEVYYFMQIPHEQPLIMKLLPQRLAFTTVNQSTCDNKQKKETGTVSGPLQFMTSLDSNICQNANLLWCDCNSYLAGRPRKRKYKRCGKAVAAGRVFCQVKAIDREGPRKNGWVSGWEHGSEEAAGVGKRKHNHISSQTNPSPLMEMDRGSAFQSLLEIPTA